MEDILITPDGDGGRAVLTTRSPASHDSYPVLRIKTDDDGGDVAASDLVLKCRVSRDTQNGGSPDIYTVQLHRSRRAEA